MSGSCPATCPDRRRGRNPGKAVAAVPGIQARLPRRLHSVDAHRREDRAGVPGGAATLGTIVAAGAVVVLIAVVFVALLALIRLVLVR